MNWLEHSRIVPHAHQIVGVKHLITRTEPEIGRVYPGCFGLFDETGAGKTKQVIDAAQLLFVTNEIDAVAVVAPASVRSVWFDDEIGELAAHLWYSVPADIVEYHGRIRTWRWGPETGRRMRWVITNYDYIRGKETAKQRLAELAGLVGPRALLVVEESSAVKNSRARQARAVYTLRKGFSWVVELNGTPITRNPLDMYMQGKILDRRILDCQTLTHFRARYAIMGGYLNKQIFGWQNLEDLQARLKPYVIRRLKKDCLDLPEKLPSVAQEVRLDHSTWRMYRDIRDELVHELEHGVVTVAQAGVRVLRLAQITAGFLGGLEEERTCSACEGDPEANCESCWGAGIIYVPSEQPPIEIGQEKLRAGLEWMKARLEEEEDARLLVWCRFRAEVARLLQVATKEVPEFRHVAAVWGGQKRPERREALHLLHPKTAPPGPLLVVGTPGAGAVGLNFAASHWVLWSSNGTSLYHRLQADDRVHRPGQRFKVAYTDLMAVGPNGQRTIDHTIVAALKKQEDLATWTASAWVRALREE